MFDRVRRFLRSPRTIVGELLSVAVAAATSTGIPQEEAGPSAWSRFASEWPMLARAGHGLGFDHVFRAWWFFALLVCALGSLAIVQAEQWRRLGREWRSPLSEASFRSAPFRREFVRAARRGRRTSIECRGRLGHLGSPLFHLGLLLVIVSGLLRFLFAASAQADLVEGETLPPDPSAYGAQWVGPLARPFVLQEPITLVELDWRRYPSGDLEGLSGRLAVGARTKREFRAAINAPLDLGWERFHLTSLVGPAALFEVPGGGVVAFLLRAGPGAVFEANEAVAGDLSLRLRAEVGPGNGLPGAVEMRVLRDGALLFVGLVVRGDQVRLASGERFRLVDVRRWVRAGGSRDISTPIAYVALGLALAGAVIMMTVVRVDTGVFVRPDGDVERVEVAMRPWRFAPLFADRFEGVVQREGGDRVS